MKVKITDIRVDGAGLKVQCNGYSFDIPIRTDRPLSEQEIAGEIKRGLERAVWYKGLLNNEIEI